MQVGLVAMVRKTFFGAALAYCMAVVPSAAAGKTVAACQYLAASGLEWQAGRWVPQQYVLPAPFFLSLIKGRLDPESVSKVFETNAAPHCVADFALETCIDPLIGSSLFFSFSDMQGSVSRMLGSAYKVDRRDSLAVMPFVCQAM
jgi:hypothetical protein